MEFTFVAPEERKPRPTKSTRISKGKTRTGCITCKIRRVKCDEHKPNCLRCTSTGRKCDGYAVIEIAASKVPKSTAVVKVLAPTPLQQITTTFTGSLTEQRALAFFFERTAPQLSGFFDGTFWSGLVPQLSASELAIRHAVIAVSSFHEKTEQVDRSQFGSSQDLATSEVVAYNTAVNSLIMRLDGEQGSIRIPLTGCILFICMEFLRGDVDAAMTHIESGIKVLKASRERKSRPEFASTATSSWDSDSTDAHLAPMFCALFYLATLFGKPALGIYSSANDAGSSIPTNYSNMSEAKIDLFDLLNTSLQFIESVGEARYNFSVGMNEIVEKIHLVSRLDEWNTSFEAFAEMEGHQWSNFELGAANVLRAGFLAMKVKLLGSLEPDEMSWDEYKSEYEEIVELSQKVLLAAAESPNKPLRYFSFEPGIISPLHFVAWRCRWPLIRRKALSLLYLHPRREGLHNSRRSYDVMKRVMLVEELSLGIPPGQEPAWNDLPPEWARIHQGDVTLEPATPIGTPVSLISKPDGLLGDWYIRREFIHLGNIMIHGSVPMVLGYNPGSDLVGMEHNLSQSSGTSGSSFRSLNMPLMLKPTAAEDTIERASEQYHRRKRLFAPGGPIVEGVAHEISPLGAIISDPITPNW